MMVSFRDLHRIRPDESATSIHVDRFAVIAAPRLYVSRTNQTTCHSSRGVCAGNLLLLPLSAQTKFRVPVRTVV